MKKRSEDVERTIRATRLLGKVDMFIELLWD